MLNDIFKCPCVLCRKRVNISVTLVSESYVLLNYEKKVYMLFINKICLNQKKNSTQKTKYRATGTSSTCDSPNIKLK